MRYKDVVREQILGAETAEDAISSDENSDDDGANNSGHGGARGLVYDQEQEQLRKGFLGSVAEHEGGVGEGSDSSGEEDGEGESGLLKASFFLFLFGLLTTFGKLSEYRIDSEIRI